MESSTPNRDRLYLTLLLVVSLPLMGFSAWRGLHENSLEAVAALYAQKRVMTAADFLRYREIAAKAKTDHSLTDLDLDDAIRIMSAPSANPAIVHVDMMNVFQYLKSPTDSQRGRIYEATLMCLKGSDPGDKNHYETVTAEDTLGLLRDTRAIGPLRDLYQTGASADIRLHAQVALARLGDTTVPRPSDSDLRSRRQIDFRLRGEPK